MAKPCYRRRLALADAEEFGAANGADTLGCGTLILQSHGLRILDFPLGPALHAICLHFSTSLGTLDQQRSKLEAICQ